MERALSELCSFTQGFTAFPSYFGTFLKIGAYRIEIRTREHGVPHFHVVGPNGEASVSIANFRVLAANGVNTRDLRKICDLLEEHKETMLEVWNENQKD